MLCRSAFLVAGILLTSLGPLFAQEAFGEDHGILKRVSMEIIVSELTNRGVKVGLITVPSDPAKAVTMAQEAKIIQAMPESERSWRESFVLGNFQRHATPPECTIAYRDECYSINLPGDLSNPETTKETLQKVVALDSRYELIWSKGFPVICPRNDSVRDIRVNITLVGTPAFDAVGKLGEALAGDKLNLVEASIGPTPTNMIYGTNQISLNFVNVPLIGAFCRFAEALGADYNWEILGTKGYGRNFGFGRVAH